MRASSINFHDTLNLEGLIPGAWPRVPMSDAAGEVVAVAVGVSDFTVGDRVMSSFHPEWLGGPATPAAKADLPGDTEDGWLQQYRVAATSGLIPIPDNLTDIEAATLPCAGVTAWHALSEANIGPGDVVVTQGTGGVSLFATQFAHAMGATVILTSSSDKKLQIGAKLGATHLINYRTTPEWEHEVMRLTGDRGADLVVDLGGPETLAHSVRAGRMGATVAVVGILTGFQLAPIPISEVLRNDIRITGITVGSVLSFLELCELINEANIKPHISHIFDWTELPEAARVMRAGEHIGKIALMVP